MIFTIYIYLPTICGNIRDTLFLGLPYDILDGHGSYNGTPKIMDIYKS
jgi:hypothetical protein